MSEAIASLREAESEIAEPSGSAALAAVLAGKVKAERVVAVVSGGNVDDAALREIVSEVRPRSAG
jgi:threonine dehydratase